MRETETPKDLLRKYGVHPRKRLGQSFLLDLNVIDKIIRIAGLTAADTVVEIGAGLGVLTALIAGRAGQVIALEIDDRMISILREELRDLENVSIIETDVLHYDFAAPLRRDDRAVPCGKLKIIGNIPYNISSLILFHLLEHRLQIHSMVLMLQKEVAERITALPGTKAYGTLSVILAMYFVISREFSVPGSCFYPPPRVDSAVIRMTARDGPAFPLTSAPFFQRVVRAAFAQRRKTLINNLRFAFHELSAGSGGIAAVLDRLGMDGRRRGETLSVEEFARLSNELLLQQKT
jgi:16S rRNA (adenine1518-N6/adenine1519-N6)-dimethyltransferase